MVRPDFAKWNQTAQDLLRLATEAEHARSRERYLALYMIGTEQSNATQWAQTIGRNDETVLGWVHQYNAQGPEGVAYRPSGGRTPFLPRQSRPRLPKPSSEVRPSTMGSRAAAGP
jgi:hypothetical protein